LNNWLPEDDDAPGVLEYQGRKYAVNLLWLMTGEDDKKTLRQRRIKKSESDFYCLRTHVSKQIGFGWLERGHRRNMPVAATIVADQLVGEWHGVFQADNGWWYMQVHSDAIAPRGDRFFAAESDAYAVFHENLTKHSWSHSYAPTHWNVAEASREMTLARLLDDLPSVVLQPASFDAAVGGVQNRNMLLIGMFTLMVMLIGVYVFSSLWTPPEQVISAPRNTPIPALQAPKRDVVELPLPSQVINQCYEGQLSLFKPLPGWMLKTMNCTPESVSISWEGDDKNAALAQESVRSVPVEGTVSISGKNMTVKKSLSRPPVLVQDKLFNMGEGVLKIQELMTPLGQLEIKPVTPAAPPPPARISGADAPRPVAARPYLDVTLKTVESMEQMKHYLDLNGLRLISVVWDIPTGVWTYRMNIQLERAR
jgi:hypothetical protein